VLEAVLTDAGHTVLVAVNGRQGLQHLARRKPDLVLLDFMMPVVDGPGMLRAMAADTAYKSIPVVMMSSLPKATVAERCSGYVAFLQKPFTLREVLDAVGRALPSPAA
jgi:CheY-like chemotaxis protein